MADGFRRREEPFSFRGSPGRWTAPVDSRTPRSRGNKTGLDRLFKLKTKRLGNLRGKQWDGAGKSWGEEGGCGQHTV